MNSTQVLRSAPRVLRSTRPVARSRFAGRRFESTKPTGTPPPTIQSTTGGSSGGSSSGALVGGLAGGALVFAGGYAYYHFSGAKTLVNTAQQTKAYVDDAFKKTVQAAPEPSEAIKWLKETVTSYSKLIPGAQTYVDQAFADLEKVEKNHRNEVDDIVKDTYSKLKDVTKGGASLVVAAKAWDVLQDCFKRLGELAGEAVGDIAENHPELKEKFGGSFKQLKQMGEQYGPEAKKQVEDTLSQVKDITKDGFSADTLKKVQKLVQEKMEQVKKLGDQAWSKGLEEAKPLLDKKPELKKMLDENKAKLLQGDLGKLWQEVKKAGESGNTEGLQKFVKSQVDSAGSKAGSGVNSVLKMIPGGEELMPKLQQLQELSDKHGKEAEKLIKSAIEDIQKVLQKKVEEGQKLKDKVEKDVKS